MENILIVDDEISICSTLQKILEYEKYNVLTAHNGTEALDLISKRNDIALVLLDIKMPGMDGLEVLKKAKQITTDLIVIIISGHGTIHTAIEATRLGAYDFIEKPLDRDKILLSIRNGLKQRKLYVENKKLKLIMDKKYRIIGNSPALQKLLETIKRVGPIPTRVLITGENGTGKELVARALYRNSQRNQEPFIQVNCAAIPKDLIESELFGHEKGSFTGAIAKRIGKFEQADGGTLFLDEIGDMSLSAQAKVLRILQEGELERVGGTQTIKVDVRVIAATNKDLLVEIEKNNFREDLYYRLNVVPIYTPLLRERLEDLSLLVNYFCELYAQEYNLPLRAFSKEALDILAVYSWPGNIRELKNIIERILIMTSSKTITAKDIPPLTERPRKGKKSVYIYAHCPTFQEFKDLSEKDFLAYKLRQYRWNISQVARELDMQRSNIYKKIEKYGIKEEMDKK